MKKGLAYARIGLAVGQPGPTQEEEWTQAMASGEKQHTRR